jgi:acetyl-CoA/propionyl-CoA carboxylase biotin carboxyl carrier protein
MVSTVLVANRGEIALRVMRGCKQRGLGTVGVYSEIDRDAPWLRLADAAYLLGPASPAESYLNTEALLEVAEKAGADAVHPGYGFLSESADFVRAVTEAGLTWIGPPTQAIESMGDKLSARAAAVEADVAVVPGTDEPTEDPQVVADFAASHGFPVAIKAAYGGGGRGMKVVWGDEELSEALEGAQREAVASFGRGEVYVERYLARPRHVEAQILADVHGNCVFIGERDCSSQRRNQKLIEEAPAPHFPDEIRKQFGEAAVRVARQVGYVNAGTVEFLYDDGDFYFLEMNTRLQVEHPVTELVWGLDLVEWQLRVADGEALPFDEDDLSLRGHAIEARINAENVAANFTPSPGKITAWRPPAGPGVRLDEGVVEGWEIPGSYDSLIGKLIGYGADRDEARRVLLRALDELVIEGVPTSVDFHRFALTHPDFIAGEISTVSVEREWDLSPIPAPEGPTAGEGAAVPSRSFAVEVGGKRLDVALFEPEGSAGDGQPKRRRRGSSTGKSGGAAATEDLTAPMQGTIVKTSVEQGQQVATGELVLVLEAMKMENHITAHRDGVVSALHVAGGDTVTTGDPLARIDDPSAASDGDTSGQAAETEADEPA